jgi:hypothetical protein
MQIVYPQAVRQHDQLAAGLRDRRGQRLALARHSDNSRRRRMVMLGEHAAYAVLVNLNAEGAWPVCWASRTQPNVGLRCAPSTIAAVGSVDRPFGPGLRRLAEEEMIRRYFRSTNALWNFCGVVGLRITDRLGMRCGLMNRVVSSSANESSELRFGARRQE